MTVCVAQNLERFSVNLLQVTPCDYSEKLGNISVKFFLEDWFSFVVLGAIQSTGNRDVGNHRWRCLVLKGLAVFEVYKTLTLVGKVAFVIQNFPSKLARLISLKSIVDQEVSQGLKMLPPGQ